MSTYKGKLASRRGETLAEVLMAILVAGLSAALLAGMISTSAKLNAAARQADEQLYEQLSAAEGRTQEVEDSVSLSLTVGGEPVHIDVTVYGAKDGLVSYAKKGARP